ncbi:MAG: RNA polymerase sigma factor (sigma-70 family) [Arenicella sp.]
MNQYSETALINLAVSNNDQNAFGELVKRNQTSVRHSLRQLSNWNESLADDLAQETFILAYKGLHRFNQKSKFSSWLYRIAYNQFLQHCRSNQAQKNYAEFEEVEDLGQLHDNAESAHSSNRAAEGQASGNRLAGTQLQAQLAKLLDQLEPERRSVLHLLLHRQCTQQEIATIMNLPLGTVKSHITRGRAILQKQLAHWQD